MDSSKPFRVSVSYPCASEYVAHHAHRLRRLLAHLISESASLSTKRPRREDFRAQLVDIGGEGRSPGARPFSGKRHDGLQRGPKGLDILQQLPLVRSPIGIPTNISGRSIDEHVRRHSLKSAPLFRRCRALSVWISSTSIA